ncbi:MAG: EAL domain-containing protein [Coprococcus sp.]|nr:EAL domain-containing protein [Lachnospiraceae bacterium]
MGIVFAAAIANAVIRFFYPTAVVEMLCMAIGLMFISLMLQRPEERLDMITGLDKMTAYMDDMRHAFRTRKPIHIIMVNITNYASLRELLGYGKCMQVMAGISEYMMRLDKEKKSKAAMYYLGQGKFRYVLEDTLSDHVPDIAEEINRTLKTCFVINQMSVNFIANICIADCPEDVSDVDTLMAFGDTLQTLPVTGNIMVASELMKQLHFDMMHDMDTIIESALSNKRFEVYYQPIYSVKEKKFHSAEALIRLKDEKYGFISPEVFIPVAEKSGAIHKIGDFVLEQVCAFIASDEYKKLGMSYIEVNLSVVQCMQPKLANHIMEILTRYGVRPEQLNLEITETAASISQQALEDNIKDLTNMGMKFSLDDFGTGYSNMQRIVKLPFDIIKLDRTFSELYDNPKLGIVLTNAINMIKAMKMKIVVEGVETEEMLKLFSELECEYIQGYYFSKPIPREEFVKFIQASS